MAVWRCWKRSEAWVLAALGLAVGVVPAVAQPAREPVALVLGNAGYGAQPKLPGCDVSANLVAATLTRAGVKVTRLDNPSNARLVTAISALGDEVAAAPGGRALIYYCGYVSQYADRLFLVPVEARLERPTDLLSQGVVARQLMGAAMDPDSEAGLVLMDVAVLPGATEPAQTPDFSTLARPPDAVHGGLAVAMLQAAAAGPAPLASSLADLLGAGRLEVGAALRAMQAQPGMGQSLVATSVPSQASWLLGDGRVAAPVAAAPIAATASAAPIAVAPVLAPVPPVAAAREPVPQAAMPVAPMPPIAAPAPALAEPNAADRRRLQLALQRLGYFKGRINGVFGLDTLTAIKQFQHDSDAEPSGKLTVRQSEQLLQ